MNVNEDIDITQYLTPEEIRECAMGTVYRLDGRNPEVTAIFNELTDAMILAKMGLD